VRVLAIDPGERHIGVALSDPSGTVARPLTTFKHIARPADAARIAALAAEHDAELIVIGIALDSDGLPGPQARRAENLASAVREQTAVQVQMYDESFTTQTAEGSMRAAGKSRRARREHVHAVAAAALLQGFLDGHSGETPPG
jgi:putative Holliday junction resolvase